MNKLLYILVVVLIGLLAKIGCNHAEQTDIDAEIKVQSSVAAVDSVLVINDSLVIKEVILEVKDSAQQDSIVQLKAEVKKWKRGYYKNLEYKKKVKLLEEVVGGKIVIKDGLICLDERQMDSVNLIAKDREESWQVIDHMMEVISIKDSLNIYKDERIKNFHFAVDTMSVERDSLRYVNNVYLGIIKKDKKKILFNRKGWFATAIVAAVEAAIIIRK